MTRGTGALMAAEIAEQPAALHRLLADGGGADRARRATGSARRAPLRAVRRARHQRPRRALRASTWPRSGSGLPAGLASPSTMTVYGARPDLTDVLFVAVSQSGGSPDLVDSVAPPPASAARSPWR